MNVQQANFVEEQLSIDKSLSNLAKEFYLRFGATPYCSGPCGTFYANGQKTLAFSALDGHDLRDEASRFLRKKL